MARLPLMVLLQLTDDRVLLDADAFGGRSPTGLAGWTVPHANDICVELKTPAWGNFEGDCGCGTRALVLVWAGLVYRPNMLMLHDVVFPGQVTGRGIRAAVVLVRAAERKGLGTTVVSGE